jgi:hypothetical protein
MWLLKRTRRKRRRLANTGVFNRVLFENESINETLTTNLYAEDITNKPFVWYFCLVIIDKHIYKKRKRK